MDPYNVACGLIFSFVVRVWIVTVTPMVRLKMKVIGFCMLICLDFRRELVGVFFTAE